jgi:hypothetical protein
VHFKNGLDVGNLFVVGAVVVIFITQWGISVKFPQPEIRSRIYGKLMLVFIFLTFIDAVLCVINFNGLTTKWAAWLFTPVALCLVSSYSLREVSLLQLSKDKRRSL